MNKRLLLCLGIGLAISMPMHAIDQMTAAPSIQNAMALAKEKQYAAAIAMVQQLLQTTPPDQSKEAHLTLGLLYYKAAQYDNSLSEFNAILAIDPKNTMAYYYLGHIYEQMALRETNAALIKAKSRQALEAWESFLEYSKGVALPVMHKKVSPEELRKRAEKHIRLLKEGLSHEN